MKLPEGTTEIQARVFADSSLSIISLPGSLIDIADNAFEGCEELTISVPEGSKAHEWAAAKEYSVHVSKIRLSPAAGMPLQGMVFA